MGQRQAESRIVQLLWLNPSPSYHLADDDSDVNDHGLTLAINDQHHPDDNDDLGTI